MFSFETILQDRKSHIPGSAEARLNDEINALEELQEKIYLGKLGLKPTIKMEYLDEIFLNHKCFNIDMELCEDIEESAEYDFTEDMIKFNVDELISEYLDRARSILYKSNIKYQKKEVDIYNTSITLDNFREYRQKFLDDNDCQFQYDIFDYIIGALQKYESIIYDIIYDKIKDGFIYIITFYIIGILLIFYSIYCTFKIINETFINIKELINILFIIPKSVVESSSEFKLFIESS
ncbi:hypothetical protein LY90DRAFT_637422 [Neocallimastix californiae]|uniref:Uncharacterized protein n=1 Tax=Neocallimastix californiae TaxID=1754190 RepID=A0A1Y1ZMG8_9FUNG|nr:hypothetical protein LY90DRAFT_637422 [Neocallimastix californiae]|eukprot:ORY11384.1 hypothetical protein LY90DRAFT_637422 [Neocallimastix californiae]